MYFKQIMAQWKVRFLNIPEWVSAHHRHNCKIDDCLKNQGKFGQYF